MSLLSTQDIIGRHAASCIDSVAVDNESAAQSIKHIEVDDQDSTLTNVTDIGAAVLHNVMCVLSTPEYGWLLT